MKTYLLRDPNAVEPQAAGNFVGRGMFVGGMAAPLVGGPIPHSLDEPSPAHGFESAAGGAVQRDHLKRLSEPATRA